MKFFSRKTAVIILCLILLRILLGSIAGFYRLVTNSMEPNMLVGEVSLGEKVTYLFRDPKHEEIIIFNDPEQLFNYSKDPIMNFIQHNIWGPSIHPKRVIGIPGDIIEGKIEGGKTVIYRNGKKLDEPYVNTYPLISTWDKDPAAIQKDLKSELKRMAEQGATEDQLERFGVEYLQRHMLESIPKSYDPDKSFEEQPFYRIDPTRVIYDDKGKIHLIWPGTPLPARDGSTDHKGKNYWYGSDEFKVELDPKEYWVMGDNRFVSGDSRFYGPIKRSFIRGKILFKMWPPR